MLLTRGVTKLALRNVNGGLSLYDPRGALVDRGNFLGSAPEGQSFSRADDGTGPAQHFFFENPTPGAANAAWRQEAIVINEVLVKLPLSHQRARLILHPEDALIVRKNLGERLQQSNWDIFESGEMTRGGCRLDAVECEVDATMERRWQRVVDAIGSDNGWLD